MALEWIYGLPITSKVDVYSFGMTLLEIISGRRNLGMNWQVSSKHYFASWAETQISEGNMRYIVDEIVVLVEETDIEEMKRAIVIGLLCIEGEEEMRPSMEQVVQMLEGKMDPQTL
ncbi:G-type lectin S-receptor-like serine/threonine-protein kinase SD2-2 [Cryptomeria japonica]|uniref:G-type lectin S-receptor-like serine/threonine-protein kinase SD2-2 n=1 Tax=Cryptomeria japonica TaxID=3369 RepID=UPI0027DA8D75|nr:G-type lectin S-receptor-like serine/threonine-protein kinase SD2-2 [Cryptomeria japonica]